jgi:hypothetical protein
MGESGRPIASAGPGNVSPLLDANHDRSIKRSGAPRAVKSAKHCVECGRRLGDETADLCAICADYELWIDEQELKWMMENDIGDHG